MTTARVAAQPDNRISLTDQILFLGQRATGAEGVVQVGWVYEHPVDDDALKRFHQHLGSGLLGRRVERSPLPFGRHRWVKVEGPQAPLDIAPTRPRADLSDWLDERAQRPVDPEWGPAWHLGVLPMSDGATGVCLVASHVLIDGVGVLQTIVDAAKGDMRDFGYPPPRSRTKARGALIDARETVQAVPGIAKALVGAGKMALAQKKPAGGARTAPVPDGDRLVTAPVITMFIDAEQWDARANALGGNTHSLVAGFATRLGERMGRKGPDGSVMLNIPMSTRGEDDDRGNAVVLTDVYVNPAGVTEDLTTVRGEIGKALKSRRETPDETLELLPLTPFIPKIAVRRGSNMVFAFSDMPVSCSNLGDLDPAVGRIDGTDAEFFILRGVDGRVTKEFLERRPGLLTVVSVRHGGKVQFNIVAYRPGGENTKAEVSDLAADTLAEFGLSAEIV
ncbi:condensation domain-containing protein [Mycolicibacterium mengxianglii]|uniref:hypothetical protein n=1 Tax=Mycolicibacterium mengxianglii TaxID=2736649 RepID=UPI0018D1A38E|nr:hypothetical protein [Mycolicibacterium mengxianglii]